MPDKKLVALIILGVLAFFSLIYGIKTPSKYRRQDSSQPAVSGPASSSIKSLVPMERHARRSDVLSWGRNPFVLKKTEAQTFARLFLNGIVWDEKNPKAVINDRICGLGEVVGGKKIVKIERNRVVLNDGTENLELRLGQKR